MDVLNRQDIALNRARLKVASLGDSWPPLQAGLFGGSVEKFNAAEQAFKSYLSRHPEFLL